MELTAEPIGLIELIDFIIIESKNMNEFEISNINLIKRLKSNEAEKIIVSAAISDYINYIITDALSNGWIIGQNVEFYFLYPPDDFKCKFWSDHCKWINYKDKIIHIRANVFDSHIRKYGYRKVQNKE